MASQPPKLLQSSALPPAQPQYVLRGHAAQIHCVHFLRQNLRLLTGDADGWVVLWNLPIRRPVAVWKAHAGSVLGVGSWGEEGEKIITHGRDNKILVWQIRDEDEGLFSNTLPIDDSTSERKQPWLLHSLDVNALNFCSFAMCHTPQPDPTPGAAAAPEELQHQPPSILLAYPGVQDGLITLTSLLTSTRIATIPPPKDSNAGMLMAVSIHQPDPAPTSLLVVAGYESGHVALWRQDPDTSKWATKYLQKPHSQPVLSIALAPQLGCFFSSSADAVVARHPLLESASLERKDVQTRHAGQQALVVRIDGKIFATAGWDGRVRVYSAKKMSELAVLKWHKEGCYAAAFAKILDEVGDAAGEEGGGALTASQRREARSRATHWLAAGSKDGKVSLWAIY